MAWHPTDFPLLDDFNRADQTPPGGNWDPDDGIWGYPQGLRVVGNQLAATGSGYLDGKLLTTYARSQPVAWGGEIIVTPGTGVVFWWLAHSLGTGELGGEPTGLTIRYELGQGMWLQQWDGAEIAASDTGLTWAAGDQICLGVEDSTAAMWHKPSAGSWTKVGEGTVTITLTGPLHLGAEWNSALFRVDNVFGGHPSEGPPAVTPKRTLLGVGT